MIKFEAKISKRGTDARGRPRLVIEIPKHIVDEAMSLVGETVVVTVEEKPLNNEGS